MPRTKKEILFHFKGYMHFFQVTKKDNLKDLRRLIDEKISFFMKPKGDWIFSLDGVQVEKKQEEEEMVWRDIIKRDGRLELIEETICSLKRKNPPKKEDEKDEDSDFAPEEVKKEQEEDPGQGTRNGRKKVKRTDRLTVTPDRAPSSQDTVTPENTNRGSHELPEPQPSNRNVVQGTENVVSPDCAPSNRGAVTPEYTNSGAFDLPETQHNNQNVVQGGVDAVAVPSSPPNSVPIKEETRKKFATKRQKSFAQYGDRYLLHSQHPKGRGMMRLGGNTRMTFVVPRDNHPVLETSDYPTPLHLLGRESNIRREDFGYMAFNAAWQPNGPMYAGQETAAVRSVPLHFKKTKDPFPIFMKRTLTTKQHEKEGSLLGWEYVGNYKFVPFDPDDHDALFYESANSIAQASKNEIARKIFESYQKDRGRQIGTIKKWRARLAEAITQEQPHAPHSLAARCLELGFEPNMSGENLCKLIVKLDEYHGQDLIKFEYYDERIYNYCLGGKTNCTKDGVTISSGGVGGPAKAQDWYDFATVNMLFKY